MTRPLEESPDTIEEAEAMVIQTVGEISRGLDIAALELKRGRFTAARETIQETKRLLVLQDRLMSEFVSLRRRKRRS